MKPLSERRASWGETMRAALRVLRERGPMQRWQISAALGKSCNAAVQRLLDAGNVEQYLDDNRDPADPCGTRQRAQATYIAFVRDTDISRGPSERALGRAVRQLRAAGWTVTPPGIAVAETPARQETDR